MTDFSVMEDGRNKTKDEMPVVNLTTGRFT